MRLSLIAFATLFAVGLVAWDGALDHVGVESTFTGDAAAICTENPVDGSCLPTCVQSPHPKLGWECPM